MESTTTTTTTTTTAMVADVANAGSDDDGNDDDGNDNDGSDTDDDDDETKGEENEGIEAPDVEATATPTTDANAPVAMMMMVDDPKTLLPLLLPLIPSTTSTIAATTTTATTTTVSGTATTAATRTGETKQQQQQQQHRLVLLPTSRSPCTTSTTNPINAQPTTTAASTNPNMITTSTTIQMIPSASIRRIVAGPAIYDLSSCIKELMDNAIDAQATTINIRLYNKGIDIIEVSDDGVGIHPASHPYIAVPHATSKIVHFADIYSNTANRNPRTNPSTNRNRHSNTDNDHPHVAQTDGTEDDNVSQQQQQQQRPTFGFRGEALHCLANLSEQLIVATRTKQELVATKMEFDTNGTMNPISQTTIARKIGTTVAIMKLFFHLPVRYKDFTIHIKEQRMKLLQMMMGYAIFLSPNNIRFHIMDIHPTSGKEKSLFITPYYPATTSSKTVSLKDSVSSILGCHLLHSLSDITIDLSSYCLQQHSDDATNTTGITTWMMKGLISMIPGSTTTRSSSVMTDAKSTTTATTSTASAPAKRKATTNSTSTKPVHYFAINQRPVDLPIISRLINKVYKRMCAVNSASTTTVSGGGGCTCIMELVIPLSIYDINLSPDKRKVQFWNDTLLYDIMERSLVEFWSSPTTAIQQQQPSGNNYSAATSAAAAAVQTTFTLPTVLLPQQQQQQQQQEHNHLTKQEPFVARRNTSFSCGKASLVTATSLSSARDRKNNDDMNGYDDDDESINAFDSISESPAIHCRRNSSQRTIINNSNSDSNLRSSVGSSFHSVYSHDSLISANTNRSVPRRYAFVNDPQQSILKQQEYETKYDHTNSMNDRSQHQQHEQEHQKLRQPSPSFDEVETPPPPMDNDVCDTDDDNMDQKPKSRNSSNMRSGAEHIREGTNVVSVINRSSLQANGIITPSPVLTIAVDKSRGSHPIDTYNTTAAASTSNIGKEYQQFQQMQEKFRRSDSGDSMSLLRLSSSSMTTSAGQKHDRVERVSSRNSSSSSSSLLDRFGYQKNPTNATTAIVVSVPEPDISTISHISMRQHTHHPELKRSRQPAIENDQQHDRTTPKNYDKTPAVDGKNQKVTDASDAASNQNDETPTTTTTTIWAGMSSEDIVISSIQDRIATIRRRKRQRLDLSTTSYSAIAKGGNVTTMITNVSTFNATDTPSQNESSGINGSSNNNIAKRSLTKDDLQRMKVIGQFNLGFIVAMTPDNNLWILDQHACDERFQFETLQKQTTKLFEQPLLAPLPLELSYMEEACITDNMKLFERNGFRFQYDETKPSRHRFSLLAVPHSGAPDGRNAVQYGKQDVQDLCTILLGRNYHTGNEDDEDDDMYSYDIHGGTGTDGTGIYGNNAVRQYARSGAMTMSLTQQSIVDDATGESATPSEAEQIIAHLPKTIAMFASRACRNSIMIGKALSTKEMEKVILHLASVDSPWICAHGRPTICHVQPQQCDVSNMMQIDERCASEHIAGPTITCLSQAEAVEEEFDDVNTQTME